ncbi:cytochrome c oxidase assembly protein [Phenylobacterium sp.]|uniref:cytochrome c oxidase assembly protein n=1 Tax=Phenylobacterium sp. TaxID=1871053 RepID=UPI00272FEF7E|nr:cytochrome c oxidase assembly protein [Phenylobacterium sp.]MDP2213728.1 cytochrome c oxidase assembly protein [Phenylobacterium sp.]
MAEPDALGLAYCGPPPAPPQLWTSWNPDPVLLAVMGLATVIYFWRAGGRRSQDTAFLTAQAVLLVAFVSPLCALSVALFSARIAHHMLMTAVAAPLLAYALPRALSGRWLTAAGLLHMVLLWVWHAPIAYQWAVSGVASYWLMEVTLLVSATALWSAALARRSEGPSVILALILTMAQMGLLAALITFAQTPLFTPHLLTTQAFGLTPLEDQQLAGLIMWAPGALPYFVAVIWLAGRWLKGLEKEEATAWRG